MPSMVVPKHTMHLLPRTPSGWIAFGTFGASVVLLLVRIWSKPMLGLPLNYLIVFLAFVASGLIALYAAAFRHERALGVIAPLVIGLMAGIWLLGESLG
jgi:hypothetical protein